MELCRRSLTWRSRAQTFILTRPQWHAAALGLIAAWATFYSFTLVADAALLAVTLVTFRGRPPIWGLILAIPFAFSAAWAPSPWPGLLAGVRIACLSMAFRDLDRGFLAIGFGVGLLFQTAWLPFVATELRPSGLAGNASILGQVGLALFMVMPAPTRTRIYEIVPWWVVTLLMAISAALTLGIAQARASLLAAAAWTALGRSRVLALALAGVIGMTLTCGVLTGGLGRFLGQGLNAALDGRVDTAAQGISSGSLARDAFIAFKTEELIRAEYGLRPKLDPLPPTEQRHIDMVNELYPYHAPELHLFGYGYDGFVAETNSQRPHTVPVVAIFELGLLALPLFAVVAWAIWSGRVSVSLAITIGLLWLLTEEAWSAGAGHYLTALTVAVCAVPVARSWTWRRLRL